MSEEVPSGSCDVLILSAGVGAGHNQAARAIADGLRAASPHLAVRHVDALDHLSKAFRLYYDGGFKLGMTRLPWAYGLGFQVTDRPHTLQRGLTERMRLAFERLWLGRVLDLVVQARPRLIVNTHFLLPPQLARLRRVGKLAAPQMVVLTDLYPHRWWYSEGVEHWFVPSDFSARNVQRWDIPPGRITVSGMPIHPKWIAPLDRAKIYSDWHLPADKPVAILTGGTDFTCGPIVRMARELLEQCPQASIVVLAGRNKKLLADLSQLPEAGKRLFPQGFTDRSHELVEVADVMITKPGGITTAECIAKATPMVLLKPVPGQEGGNAKHFEREGAAVIARNAEEAVGLARELLSDSARRHEMSGRARQLYRPGTPVIVEGILEALQERS